MKTVETVVTTDDAVNDAAEALTAYGAAHLAWAALGIVLPNVSWYPGRYAGGGVMLAIFVGAASIGLAHAFRTRVQAAWFGAAAVLVPATVLSAINLPSNLTIFACAFLVLRWKTTLDVVNATMFRVVVLGQELDVVDPETGYSASSGYAPPPGAPPGWRPPRAPDGTAAASAQVPAMAGAAPRVVDFLGSTPLFAAGGPGLGTAAPAFDPASVVAPPPAAPHAALPAAPQAPPPATRDPFASGRAYGEPSFPAAPPPSSFPAPPPPPFPVAPPSSFPVAPPPRFPQAQPPLPYIATPVQPHPDSVPPASPLSLAPDSAGAPDFDVVPVTHVTVPLHPLASGAAYDVPVPGLDAPVPLRPAGGPPPFRPAGGPQPLPPLPSAPPLAETDGVPPAEPDGPLPTDSASLLPDDLPRRPRLRLVTDDPAYDYFPPN